MNSEYLVKLNQYEAFFWWVDIHYSYDFDDLLKFEPYFNNKISYEKNYNNYLNWLQNYKG